MEDVMIRMSAIVMTTPVIPARVVNTKWVGVCGGTQEKKAHGIGQSHKVLELLVDFCDLIFKETWTWNLVLLKSIKHPAFNG